MESRIILFSLLIFYSSCATKTKTKVYSSIAGAIVGGVVGNSLSPNKESDLFNTTLGASSGATIGYFLGSYFYNESNADIILNESPLKKQNQLTPIINQNFGMDKISITPRLIPTSSREYLKLKSDYPSKVQSIARRQYIKKYKTQSYSFEKNGMKFIIPSFEIIVNGVE